MLAWRLWLLAAAAAATIWLLAAVWRSNAPRAATVWLAAAAACVLAAGAVTEYEWQRNEARYTAAAAAITSEGSRIRCQRLTETMLDFDGNAGYVRTDADGVMSDTANLDRAICTDLATLPATAADATVDDVIALHVLAHEAYHLAGIEDEARTDCYAIQRTADVAARLGVPRPEGHQYALRYLNEVYPTMPDDYRDPVNCVAGGTFDRGIPDFPWPTR